MPRRISADRPPLRVAIVTLDNHLASAVERARLYEHMEAQVRERTEAWQSERQLLSAVVNQMAAGSEP